MAVRPIDANELYRIEKLLDTDIVRQDKVALNLLEQVLYDIQHVPTLAPPNDLLTLDELRKMDGQPVWIKQLKDLSVCDTGWALIDTCTDRIRVWWPGSEVEDEPSEEYYGKTWVAYGRPPEGEEDT